MSVIRKVHWKGTWKIQHGECKTLAGYFKLSEKLSSTSSEKKKEMEKISYALVVWSLMYATVCIRSNIAHGTSVVSTYLANIEK